VADQLFDRDDLQPVHRGEREQRVAIGPVAGVVEDLAEHAGRGEARHPREVHRRLGVAGPPQHAPLLGHEGEQVARADEVGGSALRIEDRRDRRRPLGGRDTRACRAVVHRHGERGAEGRRVGLDHHRQIEPPGDVRQDRHTDLAAAAADHEIDDLGRRLVGGADEVTLVFPVLGIDDDHHLAAGDRGHGGLDGGKTGGHGAVAGKGITKSRGWLPGRLP